jgi:hypothetical protein
MNRCSFDIRVCQLFMQHTSRLAEAGTERRHTRRLYPKEEMEVVTPLMGPPNYWEIHDKGTMKVGETHLFYLLLLCGLFAVKSRQE